MYTPSQRLSIYFTAYCCLDGEECDLTQWGLCNLLVEITLASKGVVCFPALSVFPELKKLKPKDKMVFWFPPGSSGWPERKEILIKAMEVICKK